MNKGYVHIYTGNGKGKTTAAFGVVVRMLMRDKRVYVGQFIKGMKYSETRLENFFDQLEIIQYGLNCFIENDPTEEDFARAQRGYQDALNAVGNPDYSLVVLDEIFIAHYYQLLSLEQLQELIVKKAPSVELIMTGRYCPVALYDWADLVTEMTEIKHYYEKGVLSREGVDC